jgi:hypothetical protein
MERAPITSWDGQSRSLTPIWEDYYPPSTNYFSHDAIHSEYESALSASYHQVEEEKSFPHLMPFFEGFSSSLSSSNPNTHRESSNLESYISQTPSHSTSSSLSSLPSPDISRNTTPRSSGGSSSLLALNLSQEFMSIENPIILPYIPVKLYNSYPNFSLSESQPSLPYHYPSSSQETLSIEDFSKDEESELTEDDEIHDITSSPRKRRIAISHLPKHSVTSMLKNLNEEDNNNLNDDDDKKPKKRQRTNPEQLEILESVYKVEKLPGSELRKELAVKLKMTPRRVQVWFQNKRAKEKRMGTGISPTL